MSERKQVSIIIPVLNEAENINAVLVPLQKLREELLEIIVVDGGSSDESTQVVNGLVDKVLHSSRGRARQMNAGAQQARGDYLLFLHADTQLPNNVDKVFQQVLDCSPEWGFFSLRLTGEYWLFRIVEKMINWRSRATRIATGDQCLFVKKSLFVDVGGFEEIPLMEDIALSKVLRKRAQGYVVLSAVTTSSRRWEKRGALSTILLMWYLRFLYAIGVPPASLAKKY